MPVYFCRNKMCYFFIAFASTVLGNSIFYHFKNYLSVLKMHSWFFRYCPMWWKYTFAHYNDNGSHWEYDDLMSFNRVLLVKKRRVALSRTISLKKQFQLDLPFCQNQRYLECILSSVEENQHLLSPFAVESNEMMIIV